MNGTERFVDCLYDLSRKPVPDSAYGEAKQCLLDYIGVTWAGSAIQEREMQSCLAMLGGGDGEATVIGYKVKTTAPHAAFVNGMNAHVMELDDGHRYGMMHLGSPIISALLPMCEQMGVGGRELLVGIIVGYEAALRLACAIQPSHRRRGYHTTGTCGTIGAAMGIAAALRYSKVQMKDALSAAVTSASGLLEHDQSHQKSYNVGTASLNGLMAGLMGRVGFTGPDDALFGRRGFLSAMSERADVAPLTEGVQSAYAIETIYRKAYAACRHCHAPIESALKIMAEHALRADDVVGVEVSTYEGAMVGHDHKEVKTVSSAKMSIPYCVASALVLGKAGFETFTEENIRNRPILSLMEKVEVVADEELTSLVPQKRAAVVTVAARGQTYQARTDYPKGEPENPLTAGELTDKFRTLSRRRGKTEGAVDKMIRTVDNIEEKGGNQKLFSLLS